MPKFKVGDLIKPKLNSPWDLCGVILAEIVNETRYGNLFSINVVVAKVGARYGFHSGHTGNADVEAYFDHV